MVKSKKTKKPSAKKKIKLADYNWGYGLEHEMHVFHKPKMSKTKPITDFILYDSKSSRIRLFENFIKGKVRLSETDIDFLDEIPYETTGRLCNGKWVIKKVPFDMPELISNAHACKFGKGRCISNMSRAQRDRKNLLFKLLKKDPKTNSQIKRYGELVSFPFGMTSYLKYPENSGRAIYKFKKNDKNLDKVRQEYLGSYHVTITLPHLKTISKKKFTDMHINFANQLQWIEPLLLTSFFSCDQKAVGSRFKRTKGSFRVMIIGWGNLAGSDVRKFKTGIGRYAVLPPYWRKDLKFKDVNKLKPCYKPSPAAKRENGISSLSSNFRTFGSPDPDRPDHRESGVGMTVGNGIEFRIFDHFPDVYLKELSLIISLFAENSRRFKTKNYVYNNKAWNNAVHEIMKHGWCAKLSKDYIKDLRKNLNVKIKTKSVLAFDVFKCLIDELYQINKNGDFFQIMNSTSLIKEKVMKGDYQTLKRDSKFIRSETKPVLPEINRDSWNFAFYMKMNRNKNLLKKFNKFLSDISGLKLSLSRFENTLFKHFSKVNWKKDIENIAYLLEDLDFAIVTKEESGHIKDIEILEKNIYKINNFNNEILAYFSEIPLTRRNINLKR